MTRCWMPSTTAGRPAGNGAWPVGALRLPASVVRQLPPRKEPFYARAASSIRSYPHGYDVARLGTFPGGCPVPRAAGHRADTP